jgi:hypothetical protein
MFPPALPLRSSGTPCGPIKNPLLQNKQGTTESAAVPPKLSDKHKRVVPKGRKFRGTTLLDQIDSRSCNADHSGRSYSTFSAAVRERTSLFSAFRLAPSAGSLRSTPISTFFLYCVHFSHFRKTCQEKFQYKKSHENGKFSQLFHIFIFPLSVFSLRRSGCRAQARREARWRSQEEARRQRRRQAAARRGS